ncbi:MaoC family dehydratase [Desulfatiglans anilini]|uniref:MaoC family dehydratase n=1 Tax=Desulfatiglans anilini TaxID=90728 RepID=UPI0006843A40|nr:MaoC family dehydratase [Desulfatiglans anilini]
MNIEKQIPVLHKEISQDSIDEYAMATGDFNPIHVDLEYAKETPFKGTIAHGFYILGFLSELMTREFGMRWTNGGGFDVQFKRPVRPGDTICVRVNTRNRLKDCRSDRTYFEVVWTNRKNEIVILGKTYIKNTF